MGTTQDPIGVVKDMEHAGQFAEFLNNVLDQRREADERIRYLNALNIDGRPQCLYATSAERLDQHAFVEDSSSLALSLSIDGKKHYMLRHVCKCGRTHTTLPNIHQEKRFLVTKLTPCMCGRDASDYDSREVCILSFLLSAELWAQAFERATSPKLLEMAKDFSLKNGKAVPEKFKRLCVAACMGMKKERTNYQFLHEIRPLPREKPLLKPNKLEPLHLEPPDLFKKTELPQEPSAQGSIPRASSSQTELEFSEDNYVCPEVSDECSVCLEN